MQVTLSDLIPESVRARASQATAEVEALTESIAAAMDKVHGVLAEIPSASSLVGSDDRTVELVDGLGEVLRHAAGVDPMLAAVGRMGVATDF